MDVSELDEALRLLRSAQSYYKTTVYRQSQRKIQFQSPTHNPGDKEKDVQLLIE